MYRRTTDYTFTIYGKIFSQWDDIECGEEYTTTESVVMERKFHSFFYADKPIYFQPKHGIILLVVSLDGKEYEEFVLHRITSLHAGVYFRLISISESSYIRLSYDQNSVHQHKETLSYQYQPIITHFVLQEILACFYQIRESSYEFPGEVHEYYELTYIDQGSMDTVIDGKDYHLEQFDTVLYYPGQFHTQKTDHQHTCAYLTIMFKTENPMDPSLKGRIFHTKKEIFKVLSRFMHVMEHNTTYHNELSLLYLKELLILLQNSERKHLTEPDNPMRAHYENTLLNEIVLYIHQHITESLTVDELCHRFGLSRSSLQTMFNENMSITPKRYIINLKMHQAKRMIQENDYNISEISDLLGFNSIHYFSRKFKLQYGLSPTEYAKSIHK